MSVKNEEWTNSKGDVWALIVDTKTNLVVDIQDEQLFVDPPAWPWSYDYVSKVLFAHGYRPPVGS